MKDNVFRKGMVYAIIILFIGIGIIPGSSTIVKGVGEGDVQPPVTTIEFGKPYYKDPEGTIYITSDTPIYLNATDDGSGVNATYYKINDGNWVKYAAPFSIPEDCNHAIYFYSDDNAGNIEVIKNENVSVDNYPPYHVLSPPWPNGNNGWYTSSVFVSFADAKSSFIYVQYRINGGPWQIYCEPIHMVGDGWYTIDYYAIDAVGNEGTGSFSIKIDQTPPTTTHEFSGIMGDNGWYVSDVIVTLSAEDETSGVDYTMYKLDDGSWINYTDPFVVTEDGEHILYYYSVDLAGNEEDVNEAGLKIDQTIPTIFLTVEKVDDNTWLFIADVFDETSGIAKVEFYVNGEFVGEVTEYPYEWIYNTTPPSTRFSVKGLIFNPKITEETVSFFAVIAIGRHRHSIPDCPTVQAIVYDNAGNEAINIPTSPIDIELYFYIFEQLTFQNDYSGRIGKFFINAVFEDGPYTP